MRIEHLDAPMAGSGDFVYGEERYAWHDSGWLRFEAEDCLVELTMTGRDGRPLLGHHGLPAVAVFSSVGPLGIHESTETMEFPKLIRHHVEAALMAWKVKSLEFACREKSLGAKPGR